MELLMIFPSWGGEAFLAFEKNCTTDQARELSKLNFTVELAERSTISRINRVISDEIVWTRPGVKKHIEDLLQPLKERTFVSDTSARVLDMYAEEIHARFPKERHVTEYSVYWVKIHKL